MFTLLDVDRLGKFLFASIGLLVVGVCTGTGVCDVTGGSFPLYVGWGALLWCMIYCLSTQSPQPVESVLPRGFLLLVEKQ